MASDLDRKEVRLGGGDSPRAALRRRLLQEREAFVAGVKASSAWVSAEAAMAGHLAALIAQLEPECLGLYWPMRAESNAPVALLADEGLAKPVIALPFAQRKPVAMSYRQWDGEAPTVLDDCGLFTAEGPSVVPDVVLAPCLGFTGAGLRLGYGGGYFDRWLAAHPHVTAVGVGWAIGRLDDAALARESHDVPMAVIVTEHGIVAGD